MQYAGQSNLKRVSLECGGKSPNIVLADYDDLERAATAAAFAIFFNQGEMCSAGSRLLVQEEIKDAFLDKVQEVAQRHGARRSARSRDEARRARRRRADEPGARLHRHRSKAMAPACASAAVACCESSGGYYVEPTRVRRACTPRMKIAREEIFGPVLATLTFKTVDEAIKIANDVVYGLAAAVWTKNITTAHRVARALRAGVVYVNCYDADDITVPFGGFKQSGIGRRQVPARLRQVHRTQDHVDRPVAERPRRSFSARARSGRTSAPSILPQFIAQRASRICWICSRASSPRSAQVTCVKRSTGVPFNGSLEVAYRACLESRARRIACSSGSPSSRRARRTSSTRGPKRVDWAAHIAPGATIACDFTGKHPGITHTHFGALKLKDAIVDALRDTRRLSAGCVAGAAVRAHSRACQPVDGDLDLDRSVGREPASASGIGGRAKRGA